jgi:hypothetical protein
MAAIPLTIHDILSDAHLSLLKLWREAQAPEQKRLLWHAVEAHLFIHRTGQVYRFEDYRRGLGPAHPHEASAPSTVPEGADTQRARELLALRLGETLSPEERLNLLANIDVLDFVASANQREAFEDYLEHFYSSPPPVIAYFNTREEAEAWLEAHPEPPSHGHVLVGDEYYEVTYFREEERRRLKRDYALERHIEAITAEGIPPAGASFDTLAEAQAWLAAQAAPPTQAFVLISKQCYLAVHHRNINRRALYHLTIVERWQEEKRRSDEGTRRKDAVEDGETE